jgi:hypothetical protein
VTVPETATDRYARWTADWPGMDRDALEREARGLALSAAISRAEADAVKRSWQQQIEDGMRALRRARALIDVHAKTVRMDDLRTALAECCQRCGARQDEPMQTWRNDVVCARCHDEGAKWEAGMAAEAAQAAGTEGT